MELLGGTSIPTIVNNNLANLETEQRQYGSLHIYLQSLSYYWSHYHSAY
jgi:hypothetical protein